ncbi:MAG: sodium:solute symporter family protein [Candidatus Midichloria sp.]|nr:sodium:solute symporter family protein [Candidatus Midichloria sp.]
MHNIHIIDIAIIILYFVICIAIGLHKYKSIKTLKEYTLGGRNFPNLVIVTTLFATYIGSSDVIGMVEQVHELGLFFIVPILFSPLFWLTTAKIYGKNIDQFNGCISISDIMAKLYGVAGRWITNIAALIISIVIVTISTTALGHTLHYFLQITLKEGIILGALVLTLYSAFGGIRAVAYTDVFQFIVLMLAIPASCFIVYGIESGGGIMHWHNVFDQLPKEVLVFNINKDNVGLFLSLIFWGLLPLTEGAFMQRFLLSRNAVQLTKCLKVIPFLHLFLIITVCLIGLLIKAKTPEIDPRTAFIHFISNYLCIGVKGIVITGLLAVIMSTADSWLNTAGILLTHDIIKKLVPLTHQRSLIVARISIFIIAVLSVIFSLSGKGLMQLNWLADNFWGPIIIIPLSAGFLMFRTNSKSFIASVILAITFTCVSGYIVGDFATISLMCGMIGSAIGLFCTHHWQKGQGIDPAAKHKKLAAIEEKERAKIRYANSAEQIEEWYKESSTSRNQKSER